MRRRTLFWISAFFAVLFTLYSCRQDMLRSEDAENYSNQQSKFQVVKIEDIPQVASFIRQKTGSDDLRIPMSGKSHALARGALRFSTLETDFILKMTEGEVSYYIFRVSNAGDESTIYNFEVKEVGGDVVRGELVEYASSTPFKPDYSNLYSFTGKVRAYNERMEQVSVGIYDAGHSQDCPPKTPGLPTDPPKGGGGLVVPVFPSTPSVPGTPTSPPATNFPVWPGTPPSGSSGGGGSSGGSNPPGGNCTDNNYSNVIHIYGYTSPGFAIALVSNSCGYTKVTVIKLPKSESISADRLTARCDDGSGVVILPGGNQKNTPCQKIKKLINRPKIKDTIQKYKEFALVSQRKEKGILEHQSGTLIPGVVGDDLTVSFGYGFTAVGTIHVHPLQGIAMFSPKDLVNFVKHLRLLNSTTINNAYAGMISASGNYFITFTGTASDLPADIPFGMDFQQYRAKINELNYKYYAIVDKIRKSENKPKNAQLSQQGREKLFFEMMKLMGLDGKVKLMKEDNGTVYNVSEGANGNPPTSTPCN